MIRLENLQRRVKVIESLMRSSVVFALGHHGFEFDEASQTNDSVEVNPHIVEHPKVSIFTDFTAQAVGCDKSGL